MTLFEGNLPQKRQREREKEKERKRASWMPNDVVTAGNRAPQVEFPSSVLPVLWPCTTVFAWCTPSLMNWSQVIAFGGAYRFTVFRAHLWQKTPAILKWSSTILTVTHIIYIYTYKYICNDIYIYIYIYSHSHGRLPEAKNQIRLKDSWISKVQRLVWTCILWIST